MFFYTDQWKKILQCQSENMSLQSDQIQLNNSMCFIHGLNMQYEVLVSELSTINKAIS